MGLQVGIHFQDVYILTATAAQPLHPAACPCCCPPFLSPPSGFEPMREIPTAPSYVAGLGSQVPQPVPPLPFPSLSPGPAPPWTRNRFQLPATQPSAPCPPGPVAT